MLNIWKLNTYKIALKDIFLIFDKIFHWNWKLDAEWCKIVTVKIYYAITCEQIVTVTLNITFYVSCNLNIYMYGLHDICRE